MHLHGATAEVALALRQRLEGVTSGQERAQSGRVAEQLVEGDADEVGAAQDGQLQRVGGGEGSCIQKNQVSLFQIQTFMIYTCNACGI